MTFVEGCLAFVYSSLRLGQLPVVISGSRIVPSLSLFCRRLACSFGTYALLVAYWVQSELGDWRPCHHRGCENRLSSPQTTTGNAASASAVDYLTQMRLAAADDASSKFLATTRTTAAVTTTSDEERCWFNSRCGPPQPPPLVKMSPALLTHVAHFHQLMR